MDVSSTALALYFWALGVSGILLLAGCGPATPSSVGSTQTNQPSPQAASQGSGAYKDTVPLAVTSEVDVLPGMQASPLESTNILRAFTARGVIREIPADGTSLLIKHEEIAGFMPRMTMNFDVRDTNELKGLAVGDTIVFQLKANQKESWIEGIRRAGSNDLVNTASADPSSLAILHASQLKIGETLPDAEFLAETGDLVRFSDFRGKALAFTFMFTRCPLPDYCPRMSKNFGRARELLVQQSDAPVNWQFLSISFDPGFDKAGVLTRYAYSYRGGLTNQWLFASAPTNVLAALASQVDFRFANESGSFQHNLRTVVLDTQGRVFRTFEGNKWQAEELAEVMVQAARVPATGK